MASVFLNVTAVSPTGTGGYVTLWPTGYPKPPTSNVNFPAKAVVANLCLVDVDPTGAVSILAGMIGPGLHVIVDVQGWISADPLDAVGPSVSLAPAVPTASDSVKAAEILANAVRYLMGTWWAGPAQTLLATPLTQTVPNDAVRRLGMAALGLSTAWATGVADDPMTPIRAVTLIDRLASGHVTNASGGWGEGWQTSMWAALAGRAAWYIWPQLSEACRARVARMVAHEADFAARYQIKYYRDATGNYLRNAAGTELIGDSGAEEVAWQGTAMQIALVMLPDHANAGIWSTEMQRFALAAWARPQDVAGWPQITGSNVETNGQVINHARIAPDYSTCIQFNVEAYSLFTLAGQATPQAMRQFLGPVYAALNALYVPGTAMVTYPQGCDWGTGQVLPYALADAQALAYGYDSGSAAAYLGLHLDAVLAQQARSADGRTYLTDNEYNYEGREEHTAQLAAQLWWTLLLRDLGLGSFS